MKVKFASIKWMRIGIPGVLVMLMAFMAVSPVYASDAPSTLNISDGEQAQYAYYEFGSNTQINIERGGELIICTGYENYATINADIDFLAAGSGTATISTSECLGGSPTPPIAKGMIINGDITLHADASMVAHGSTLKMNGCLVKNGHRLSLTATQGRVQGSGCIGDISLDSQSTIAPGNSPGILSTGDLTMVSGSVYDFELGGTTAGSGYDQIDVTGTVNLGSGTLNIILYGGFKPTVGQTFTIINNDGADAITGTFAGLAEGKTITGGGYSYTVSYVGGDGNDVVLTVVPTVPDTGFALSLSNPLFVFAVTITVALGIAFVAHSIRPIRKIRL